MPPPDVDVGGTVIKLVALDYSTCVLLDTREVKCWGENFYGQLGYGHSNRIGDDETPSTVGTIALGGTVAQIAGGSEFACAIMDSGAVRCWGLNRYGQLGSTTNNDNFNANPTSLANSVSKPDRHARTYRHSCSHIDVNFNVDSDSNPPGHHRVARRILCQSPPGRGTVPGPQ